MKVCARCRRWRSDREFYPDRRPGRSRDGLHHNCKPCEREAAAARARRRYQPTNTMTQPRDRQGRFLRAA